VNNWINKWQHQQYRAAPKGGCPADGLGFSLPKVAMKETAKSD
jgi:hypothetical protein